MEPNKGVSDPWKMFQKPCPECGKNVYVVSPRRSMFCSKQCESNHNYRTKRFKGTELEKWRSSDEVREF